MWEKEVLGKCDHIVEDTSLLNYNTLLQAWSKRLIWIKIILKIILKERIRYEE